MTLQVRYMGTKREIAPSVAQIISDGPAGPLLDLFSGVCAIGSAVAPTRQIWSNDAQIFSSTVAKAFFLSQELPPNFDVIADIALPIYKKNYHKLEARYVDLLEQEQDAFNSRNFNALLELERAIPHVASDPRLDKERALLRSAPMTFPYRLFSISFAGGYIGLQQAINIDSIRFAIDELRATNVISDVGHRWLVLALCQALNKVSTTTGHFAQFLRVKPETINRYVAQRIRSVWQEWLKAIFELAPIGTKKWRNNNKVYREDASGLIAKLNDKKQRPSIIYADPPYTGDQYSRYYHVYETLILYDYPESACNGRYRPDRFVSEYSLKTKVRSSIEGLIAGCAELGSALVLSYPEKGLLSDAPALITHFIKQHYGSKPMIKRFDHKHSTMGASKGIQKHSVQELIFVAGW